MNPGSVGRCPAIAPPQSVSICHHLPQVNCNLSEPKYDGTGWFDALLIGGDAVKVFLSWSGEKSKAAAIALKGWLPQVFQSVKPWMSEMDIPGGKRWGNEVSRQLDESNVGIACVTKSNARAPWLLFEAGAIAKRIDDSFMIPYLLDFEAIAELPQGPLTQFQAILANEDGTRKLVTTINSALGEMRRESQLVDTSFEVWWPHLRELLAKLPEEQTLEQAESTQDRNAILDEVVTILRRLDRDVPERKSTSELARLLREKEKDNVAVGMTKEDRELLKEVQEAIEIAAICGLPQSFRERLQYLEQMHSKTLWPSPDGKATSKASRLIPIVEQLISDFRSDEKYGPGSPRSVLDNKLATILKILTFQDIGF